MRGVVDDSFLSAPNTGRKKTTFSDADSALKWLGGLPQANTSVMLSELVTQVQAYNFSAAAPHDRFKTLEVLRETIFAVSSQCQRRYEDKPLPLLPAEQSVLVRCATSGAAPLPQALFASFDR